MSLTGPTRVRGVDARLSYSSPDGKQGTLVKPYEQRASVTHAPSPVAMAILMAHTPPGAPGSQPGTPRRVSLAAVSANPKSPYGQMTLSLAQLETKAPPKNHTLLDDLVLIGGSFRPTTPKIQSSQMLRVLDARSKRRSSAGMVSRTLVPYSLPRTKTANDIAEMSPAKESPKLRRDPTKTQSLLVSPTFTTNNTEFGDTAPAMRELSKSQPTSLISIPLSIEDELVTDSSSRNSLLSELEKAEDKPHEAAAKTRMLPRRSGAGRLRSMDCITESELSRIKEESMMSETLTNDVSSRDLDITEADQSPKTTGTEPSGISADTTSKHEASETASSWNFGDFSFYSPVRERTNTMASELSTDNDVDPSLQKTATSTAEAAILSEEGEKELIIQVTNNIPLVMAGTVVALMEYLIQEETPTNQQQKSSWLSAFSGNSKPSKEADAAFEEFSTAFIISFRSFVTPSTLLDVIKAEVSQLAAGSTGVHKVLRVIRAWVNQGWFDFSDNPKLLSDLLEVLKDCDSKIPATYLEPIRSLIQENRKRDKRMLNALKDIPADSGVSLVCVEAEQLAEQLTLFDADLFSRVHPVEYLSSVLESTITPNLQTLINRFDQEYYWVEEEICGCADPKLQAVMIDKFILAAAHCKVLNNFNSVFTIIAALDNPKVKKLANAWNCVSKESKKTLKKLLELTSTARNMKTYRTIFRKVPPKVTKLPFLPIVTKDLRFMADGNPLEVEGLLNFDRLRIMARYALEVHSNATIAYKRIVKDTKIQAYLQNKARCLEEAGESSRATPVSSLEDADRLQQLEFQSANKDERIKDYEAKIVELTRLLEATKTGKTVSLEEVELERKRTAEEHTAEKSRLVRKIMVLEEKIITQEIQMKDSETLEVRSHPSSETLKAENDELMALNFDLSARIEMLEEDNRRLTVLSSSNRSTSTTELLDSYAKMVDKMQETSKRMSQIEQKATSEAVVARQLETETCEALKAKIVVLEGRIAELEVIVSHSIDEEDAEIVLSSKQQTIDVLEAELAKAEQDAVLLRSRIIALRTEFVKQLDDVESEHQQKVAKLEVQLRTAFQKTESLQGQCMVLQNYLTTHCPSWDSNDMASELSAISEILKMSKGKLGRRSTCTFEDLETMCEKDLLQFVLDSTLVDPEVVMKTHEPIDDTVVHLCDLSHSPGASEYDEEEEEGEEVAEEMVVEDHAEETGNLSSDLTLANATNLTHAEVTFNGTITEANKSETTTTAPDGNDSVVSESAVDQSTTSAANDTTEDHEAINHTLSTRSSVASLFAALESKNASIAVWEEPEEANELFESKLMDKADLSLMTEIEAILAKKTNSSFSISEMDMSTLSPKDSAKDAAKNSQGSSLSLFSVTSEHMDVLP